MISQLSLTLRSNAFILLAQFMCSHKERLIMKAEQQWNIRLITPNYLEAKAECDIWVDRGYSTHYSESKDQVEIKKAGPQKALYFVRTRVKK